jgi:hypothetical protein
MLLNKNFMEGFKLSFNEKFLKEQFGKNLNILPVKGAKLGKHGLNLKM